MINNYSVTRDSVTVIHDGRTHVVKHGQSNFAALRASILDAIKDGDWSAVPDHLSVGTSLARWAKGRFKVEGDVLLFDGRPVAADLTSRIEEMAAEGQDPTPLLKFWERVQANPSHRSIEQLWPFLKNVGIPLTADGFFLAYKGVRTDFKDCHSGTIDNRPGVKVDMPRNQISDDPNTPCHEGLHVGAREYASSFGPRVVICKVDPADVVCVPYDHSHQKMRVCRYEVVGLDSGQHLPTTTIPDSDLPKVPKNKGGKRSAGFKKLDGLDEAGLMECKLDTLRAYASRGLSIVGASRIPGGKWALVEEILVARQSQGI